MVFALCLVEVARLPLRIGERPSLDVARVCKDNANLRQKMVWAPLKKTRPMLIGLRFIMGLLGFR